MAITLSWSQHASLSPLILDRASDRFMWNTEGHFEQVITATEQAELAVLEPIHDLYCSLVAGAVVVFLLGLVFGGLCGDFRLKWTKNPRQERGFSTDLGDAPASGIAPIQSRPVSDPKDGRPS
jgi:hypothetical protein